MGEDAFQFGSDVDPREAFRNNPGVQLIEFGAEARGCFEAGSILYSSPGTRSASFHV